MSTTILHVRTMTRTTPGVILSASRAQAQACVDGPTRAPEAARAVTKEVA